MPWVKLDEMFPEHPKVLAAGDEAAWLFVCALAYCNRNLTDGMLHASYVSRLTSHRRPRDLVARLVAVGMLTPVEGGWQIHDYDQYQSSRAKVLEEREKARARMARVRGNGAEHSADVRLNIQHTSASPTRPDQTRPNSDRQTDISSSPEPGLEPSVVSLIHTTALAIGMRERPSPSARFVAGIARNVTAERLDEVLKVHDSHSSLEAKVTRLCGDATYARLALEAST